MDQNVNNETKLIQELFQKIDISFSKIDESLNESFDINNDQSDINNKIFDEQDLNYNRNKFQNIEDFAQLKQFQNAEDFLNYDCNMNQNIQLMWQIQGLEIIHEENENSQESLTNINQNKHQEQLTDVQDNVCENNVDIYDVNLEISYDLPNIIQEDALQQVNDNKQQELSDDQLQNRQKIFPKKIKKQNTQENHLDKENIHNNINLNQILFDLGEFNRLNELNMKQINQQLNQKIELKQFINEEKKIKQEFRKQLNVNNVLEKKIAQKTNPNILSKSCNDLNNLKNHIELNPQFSYAEHHKKQLNHKIRPQSAHHQKNEEKQRLQIQKSHSEVKNTIDKQLIKYLKTDHYKFMEIIKKKNETNKKMYKKHASNQHLVTAIKNKFLKVDNKNQSNEQIDISSYIQKQQIKFSPIKSQESVIVDQEFLQFSQQIKNQINKSAKLLSKSYSQLNYSSILNQDDMRKSVKKSQTLSQNIKQSFKIIDQKKQPDQLKEFKSIISKTLSPTIINLKPRKYEANLFQQSSQKNQLQNIMQNFQTNYLKNQNFKQNKKSQSILFDFKK